MKRAGRCLAGLLAGLLLAAAGCTVGHTPPPVPSATPVPAPDPTSIADSPSPSRSPLTAQQLSHALLGPQDLPGFQVAPSSNIGTPPADDSQFAGCPQLDAADVPDTAAHATVMLQKSALGPYLSESLTATSEAIAKETVDGLATVVDSCPRSHRQSTRSRSPSRCPGWMPLRSGISRPPSG